MSQPQYPADPGQPGQQPYPAQPGQQPYPPQPYPPQAGQQPYPLHPGQQPAPGQAGAAAFGSPAAPPVRKRPKIRLILSLIVALFVVVLVLVGYVASRDDASKAKVNDCLAGQDEKSLKKVDCAKAHDWKVVGKIDDKSETEFDENTCAAYQESTAAYWWGDKGKKGSVLCLAPAN